MSGHWKHLYVSARFLPESLLGDVQTHLLPEYSSHSGLIKERRWIPFNIVQIKSTFAQAHIITDTCRPDLGPVIQYPRQRAIRREQVMAPITVGMVLSG